MNLSLSCLVTFAKKKKGTPLKAREGFHRRHISSKKFLFFFSFFFLEFFFSYFLPHSFFSVTLYPHFFSPPPSENIRLAFPPLTPPPPLQ